MAIKTIAAQLEEVQTAITKVTLGAQSYQMGDIRVTKADLATLRDMEKDLRSKYNRTRKNAGRILLNLSGGQ